MYKIIVKSFRITSFALDAGRHKINGKPIMDKICLGWLSSKGGVCRVFYERYTLRPSYDHIYFVQRTYYLFLKMLKQYCYLISEYDECTNAQEHGCEHDCINTLGGYECQCMIGYELHSDEKRCERR